ncbi:hypothetical protein HZ326_16140 [Fusarium oxysporum f. sp. albedinis]|nr:hypothetical protein HZ326_16140 [Fusarium oxysporum f. sp. albedinis]
MYNSSRRTVDCKRVFPRHYTSVFISGIIAWKSLESDRRNSCKKGNSYRLTEQAHVPLARGLIRKYKRRCRYERR